MECEVRAPERRESCSWEMVISSRSKSVVVTGRGAACCAPPGRTIIDPATAPAPYVRKARRLKPSVMKASGRGHQVCFRDWQRARSRDSQHDWGAHLAVACGG